MRKFLIAAAAIVFVSASVMATEAPPFWAYPLNPSKRANVPDAKTLLHVPGSKAAFTKAQLEDVFHAADWFAGEHPVPPNVILHGHAPDVWACGYCHTPQGQGRPENASLAGQPADYIIQQVMEMRSGNRHSTQPKMIAPRLMLSVAKAVTAKELHNAANYFSHLKYTSRIRVVESATVPKTYTGGVSMLAVSPNGGTELIGARIIEVPENFERTELRDPHSGFIAYVPPGSIARGKALVETGAGAAPCSSCHGLDLKGMAGTPALAGRSPSYLYRQLFDMEHGSREGQAVELMLPEVAHLDNANRIAIAAYLASLKS